jgi:alpha-galactosidase
MKKSAHSYICSLWQLCTFLTVISLATAPLPAVDLGGQLAPTPPMGWMSWNNFGPNMNEQLVKEMADAMVSSGMRDAGYRYICIDDYWQGKRDAQGVLQPDPLKFPHGIKVLADYVHSKGLKLGIYSDAAELTCEKQPASFGHEEKDAAVFASWGVDYLKYDYCFAPEDQAAAIKRYSAMSQALRKTGRPIVFSVCEWGPRKPWLWGARAGGQLWRTTWDIREVWHAGKYEASLAGILDILDRQAGLEKYSGPGGWNDPDMLVVGLYGKGKYTTPEGYASCTETEYRSQMSLWCLLAAPLMATNDLRSMNAATREILTNREVTAIDQDPLGKQASRILKEGDSEIWARTLADGSRAVGLLNRADAASRTIKLDWKILGLGGKQKVRDLWAHRDLGVFQDQYEALVPSHAVIFLKIPQP